MTSTPASTCFQCRRPGIISTDQTHLAGISGHGNDTIRFHCTCRHEWHVRRDEAELQGRFLDKARLR